MVDFGKRLRELRIAKNLTQKQLASQIGVKNSIISFYEMGDRLPSPEIIIKLAAVFRVSTDFLMGVDSGKCVTVDGLSDEDIVLITKLIESLRAKK